MNSLNVYLAELFKWQSILDIVLISTGLVFVYRTFLRLGTWKVLVGVLTAFLLFVVASFFHLEGIGWVLRNISHVAVLALIIIFQPELRKLFEKIVSLRVGGENLNERSTSTTVAESLWTLAKQKRGALVVFPGREELTGKISGGYVPNSVPSQPLLLSIFDPHSPGHDGAVVIRNNIITNFGVRLPMSKSSRLAEDYGTRHHAAMGLSEESDAFILVVSEERGVVSAFRGGEMRRLSSVEEIEQGIEDFYTHSTGSVLSASNLRTVLNPQLLLQIVCASIFALVFWSTLIIGQSELVERLVKVPLQYQASSKGLMMTNEKVSELTIHLAGPKSAFTDLPLNQLVARIDLNKMSEGKQRVLISAQDLNLPSDITLVEASPASLEMNMAAMVEKSVQVVPQLIGRLPEGLKLKEVTMSPDNLLVLKPSKKDGKREPALSTTPIYLDLVHGSSNILCKIIAPPNYQPIDKRWPDVEVNIIVE